MKKKLVIRLMLIALVACIYSCSAEDDHLNDKDEKYIKKFQVFSAKNGETVNYGNGFKTLLERYDEIHDVQHTAKTLKNAWGKSSKMSDEYIEFNIRSQDITTKDNEIYTLFPLIKNYTVDGIIIAVLRDGDTQVVEFLKMSPEAEHYNTILELFRAQYLKSNLKNKLVNKGAGGPCGFDGYPPCDIDPVVIPTPGSTNPGNSLPPGGGYIPPGGCSPYIDCIYNDVGGGGGGSTSSINPCYKMKMQTNNSTFKGNVTTLEGKTGDTYESGFRIGNGGQNQILQNKPGTSDVDLKAFPNTIFIMHSHYDGLYPIFSPGDIIFFNQWIVWAQNYNANPANTPKIPLDQLTFTVVTSWGT